MAAGEMKNAIKGQPTTICIIQACWPAVPLVRVRMAACRALLLLKPVAINLPREVHFRHHNRGKIGAPVSLVFSSNFDGSSESWMLQRRRSRLLLQVQTTKDKHSQRNFSGVPEAGSFTGEVIKI